MKEVLSQMKNEEIDMLVYATPLYVDGMTGIMKNFMDRCLPLGSPSVIKDENGECIHPTGTKNNKKLKIVAISNCGFTEISQFQALDHHFQRFARNASADYIGKIFRTMGPLLSEPACQKFVDPYKEVIRKATQEILENDKISPETEEKLNRHLIPEDIYIQTANGAF